MFNFHVVKDFYTYEFLEKFLAVDVGNCLIIWGNLVGGGTNLQ